MLGGLSLVVVSGGYSLVVVHKFVNAIAYLVVEHRLQSARASVVAAGELRSCSSQALEHRLNSCVSRA